VGVGCQGLVNGFLQHGPQGVRAVLYFAIEKEDSDEKSYLDFTLATDGLNLDPGLQQR